MQKQQSTGAARSATPLGRRRRQRPVFVCIHFVWFLQLCLAVLLCLSMISAEKMGFPGPFCPGPIWGLPILGPEALLRGVQGDGSPPGTKMKLTKKNVKKMSKNVKKWQKCKYMSKHFKKCKKKCQKMLENVKKKCQKMSKNVKNMWKNVKKCRKM